MHDVTPNQVYTQGPQGPCSPSPHGCSFCLCVSLLKVITSGFPPSGKSAQTPYPKSGQWVLSTGSAVPIMSLSQHYPHPHCICQDRPDPQSVVG